MIRITDAKPLEGYRLKLRFSDGLEAVYSVAPEQRGGVFLSLRDPAIFNAVRINPEFGCVEWPGGVDLCPTSMHQEVLASAETTAALSTAG